MLLFFLLTSLPSYVMDYQKSEVFYVGVGCEEVKCLVGILCHCPLLSKISCFLRATDKHCDSLYYIMNSL